MEEPLETQLTVEFSPPRSRSMLLRFSAGESEFKQDFSTHIFPFLEPICHSIRILHDYHVNDKIRLLIGAPECDLRFTADVGSRQAELSAAIWPDRKRTSLHPPSIVFAFAGTRAGIIAPFVQAFRNLRTSISDADFEREYGGPFPSRAHQALLDRVNAGPPLEN